MPEFDAVLLPQTAHAKVVVEVPRQSRRLYTRQAGEPLLSSPSFRRFGLPLGALAGGVVGEVGRASRRTGV